MSAAAFLASCQWTGITVAYYVAGLALQRLSRRHPLANPALLAIGLTVVTLELTHTPYRVFFQATWVLTFLLAPATVALGIPLARNLVHVRSHLYGVAMGLLAGSLGSMASGVWLVRWLGGDRELALSMLPKAATSPVAMTVAGQIGGQPALAATLAILGGILTAITLRAVLGLLRIRHASAVGLAAGTAGSGIGGAQAAALGDGPAAFAAIGIGLNALVTALFAPSLAAWLV